MTGPAQGPTGSSGQSGPRQEREPESAAFETARVGTRRARQPLIVLGFVAILASVVAVGVGGRTAPSPTEIPPRAAVATPSGTASEPTEAAPTPAIAQPSRAPIAVIVAGADGPIELVIRRPAASIFVHGDVYATKVTWIYFSLQDETGDVTGFASVSVPGSAVPNSIDGPSMRFDIDVALPPHVVGQPVWVQAIAYDTTGKLVGTVRVGVAADGALLDGPTASGTLP